MSIGFFSELWIGYHKPATSSNSRTVGGRIPTFSNFWAAGADYGPPTCVKLVMTSTVLDKFMYYSRWEMEGCDEVALRRICMSTPGE